MSTATIRRLDAIESGLPPLARAHILIARGVHPEAWPDAELDAYCETLPPEIKVLTDDELEAVLEAPEHEQEALAKRYAEAHGYGR